MSRIVEVCVGIAAIAGMVVLIVLCYRLQAFVFEYYVTASGFEIRLFRLWPIYRLKFEDIVQVRVARRTELRDVGLFTACYRSLYWGNRYFTKRVLLEKRGWIRFVVVTPADAEAFAAEIRRHISA